MTNNIAGLTSQNGGFLKWGIPKTTQVVVVNMETSSFGVILIWWSIQPVSDWLNTVKTLYRQILSIDCIYLSTMEY